MKKLKSILFVIFVAALAVNIAACKDDKDSASSSKIAGTWYCEGFSDEVMVFNADGTGAYIYAPGGINDPFTFSYDEKAGTLSFLRSDGFVETVNITIDGNRMYLYDEDGIAFADIYVRN